MKKYIFQVVKDKRGNYRIRACKWLWWIRKYSRWKYAYNYKPWKGWYFDNFSVNDFVTWNGYEGAKVVYDNLVAVYSGGSVEDGMEVVVSSNEKNYDERHMELTGKMIAAFNEGNMDLEEELHQELLQLEVEDNLGKRKLLRSKN